MNRKLISLAVIAVIAALSSTPALADEARHKATRHNNVGIMAGGVLGAIVGGPPGAIAGMAVGGVTVDREQQIRRNARLGELEALADSRVDAELLAQGLELEIGFRTDSASLPDGASDALEALAGLLQAAPGMEVRLDGYADPRGAARHNMQLSAARAAAVRDRLVEAGVAPERIRLTAHGAQGMLAPGASADPDGWALQRRVSIRLESREEQLAAGR